MPRSDRLCLSQTETSVVYTGAAGKRPSPRPTGAGAEAAPEEGASCGPPCGLWVAEVPDGGGRTSCGSPCGPAEEGASLWPALWVAEEGASCDPSCGPLRYPAPAQEDASRVPCPPCAGRPALRML